MKHLFIVISILVVNTALFSQISMQTNLPLVVGLSSEVTFEVKIKKGSNTNFSKYQLDVPEGIIIKEVDSKFGSFVFEENRAKIIWVITPSESEFTFTMKLFSGSQSGSKSLVQKYFYMENDDKKEVEMESLSILVKDSASGTISISNSTFITLNPKNPTALYTATVNPSEMNTSNPEALKQQVLQLKRDSKDAFVVGEREKQKANSKLKQANEEIMQAKAIPNEDEKKLALEKANANKQQAEKDIEVAGKVLVLAKMLDDNANDIDRINRSVNPGSYGAQVASNSNSKNSNTIVTKEKNNSNETDSHKDIEKLKKSFKESEPVDNSKSKVEDSAPSESGITFKVQVGAFGKEPAKSDFKALGKVSIVTDNGMFKVLVGSFGSKEEAFKKREEVITKGFDGFVVSYQNGLRVK